MQNITAQYLQDFYTGVSKEQVGKLSVFLDALTNAPVEEVKKACAEAAKLSETLKVRMSEVRQIWGAIHYADLKLDAAVGYNKASDTARKALREKHIDWQNRPVKSKEERQATKAMRTLNSIAGEALAKAGGDVNKLADTIPGVRLERAGNELKDSIQVISTKFQLTPDEVLAMLHRVAEQAEEIIKASVGGGKQLKAA